MSEQQSEDPGIYTEARVLEFLEWLAVQIPILGGRDAQLLAAWVIFKGEHYDY